jgi:hypothetical protein
MITVDIANVQKNLSVNAQTLIVGVASSVRTINNEFGVFAFFDGSTMQGRITIDPTGHVKAWRGSSTVLGTSASAISFGPFHYIECKYKVDPSAGIVEVKVDGVVVLSLTSQNTRSSSNSYSNGVILAALSTGAGTTVWWDDFYICDDTTSADNTYLGDVKILCSLPTANGSTNNYTNAWASWAATTVMVVGQQYKDANGNIQRVTSVTGDAKTGGSAPTWATAGGSPTTDNHVTTVVVGSGANPGAANWMAVSEIPPDDSNSYVTDATPGDIDRYTFASVAGSQVKAVVVNMRADKDDSGTRTIRAACKSGSTTADSGTDLPLTLGSYADLQGIFPTDPNTGIAWTISGVNAAEFGVKTTA